MAVRQYEIALVNLDPTVGSEIKKTRPFVILSPDEMNDYLKTVTIAPMTTKSRDYPTRVKVRQGEQDGWVVLDKIRTIDQSRFIRTLGKLNAEEITQCKAVIREIFVD